ncbi:MAG TPA: hypothetical protein VGD45_20235 [Steroidobacter sp.]|uniref:hypothetical protein n=1 Tax=Steroidobacter sp. TaxID=1978227 RepID=UPI002EDB184A
MHAAAGKAIAELVAAGTLRHFIIDMADFAPGGQAKFFIDFAPTLLRRMRGVVYLVLEEAHLFAPKERSGMGDENMMIHWAKMLATAGRSKGIRLVLVTQRTQSLHNALLGSCDTMIAQRMTAPADQKPVKDWLKANVDPATRERVESSLASLKTGAGWLCSGEARVFELVQFPRASTFDNTATPTGDGDAIEVRTATVDREKLRAIVGDAVAKAQANDPSELKKRINDLERQLATGGSKTDADVVEARQTGERDGFNRGVAHGYKLGWDERAKAVRAALESMSPGMSPGMQSLVIDARPENPVRIETRQQPDGKQQSRAVAQLDRPSAWTEPSAGRARQIDGGASAGDAELGTGGKRRILTALAQYPEGLTQRKLSILVDISPKGGTWRTYMAELRGRGWVEGGKDRLRITRPGRAVLGAFEPLPTGEALIEYWRHRLGDSGKRKIFDAVCAVYPDSISVDDVSRDTNIAVSGGTWRTYMAELRRLGIIEGRGELRASEDLFS